MTSVDVHAHLFPPSAVAALEGGREWFGSTLSKDAKGSPVLHTGGRRRGLGAAEHLQPPADRVRAMDALGVDVQVLSLVPPLFGYDLPAQVSADLCRQVNDETEQLVVEWPGRFLAFATLPAADTDRAVAEVHSAMARQGVIGIEVGTNVLGSSWDDDRLFPILEAAQEVGALVFLHPNDVRSAGMLDRYYLHNALGNPFETTEAVASLVFGRVLDRLPDLQVCLAHGGGYLAAAVGRLDHVARERGEARGNAAHAPSDYLGRFVADALVHDARTVRHLVDVLGADHVVLGSDYPADMGPRDPVGEVRGNDLLTDDEKQWILHGTLERLLGRPVR